MSDNLAEVMAHFQIEGQYIKGQLYGDGHINDTYQIWMAGEEGEVPYLLQRINHRIFKDPIGLVDNIDQVTKHIKDKLLATGGNPDREVLQLIPTTRGDLVYTSDTGNYYRCYVFIRHATTYLLVENPMYMYHAGKAFGTFQGLLADFPVDRLIETIPDFHNTYKRYLAFEEALRQDVRQRKDQASQAIDFILERRAMMSHLVDLHEAGRVPTRVTHNDTKFNNVMIDDETGQGICIVDLDTVMPGLSLYDFGDAIRSGTNTAREDEQDLSLVSVDLDLFQAYTRGYLEACGHALVADEIDHLVVAARMMTLECGMRFLTDYLEGDHYFKTAYEDHNLVRCKNQLALVKDMEDKAEAMEAIVRQTYAALDASRV